MVRIICPEELRKSVADWLDNTNKTISPACFPNGMYAFTEKKYGFLAEAIDGKGFEWEKELPDPAMLFSRLAAEFPLVELSGYIPVLDPQTGDDHSVKISSASGEGTLEEESIDEAGRQAICRAFENEEREMESPAAPAEEEAAPCPKEEDPASGESCLPQEEPPKMRHIFIAHGADTALFQLDLSNGDVERHSYVVDFADVPMTCSVTWEEDHYVICTNIRLDNGDTQHRYGEPISVHPGDGLSVNTEKDSGNMNVMKLGAAVASQMDKLCAGQALPAASALPAPEHGGLLVSVKDGKLNISVVEGAQRPELACFDSLSLLLGQLKMIIGRPYIDEPQESVLERLKSKAAEEQAAVEENKASAEEQDPKE